MGLVMRLAVDVLVGSGHLSGVPAVDQGLAHGFGQTPCRACSPPQPFLPLHQQPCPCPDVLRRAGRHPCSLPHYLTPGWLGTFSRKPPCRSVITISSPLSASWAPGPSVCPWQLSVLSDSQASGAEPEVWAVCIHSGAPRTRPGLPSAFARWPGSEARQPAAPERASSHAHTHVHSCVGGLRACLPGHTRPRALWRGAGT